MNKALGQQPCHCLKETNSFGNAGEGCVEISKSDLLMLINRSYYHKSHADLLKLGMG